MQFIPIKTRILIPPKDDFLAILENTLLSLEERDIVFITSKVVAIHQGRCIKADTINKKELIQKEADAWVPEDCVPGKDIYLTIKNNILIPSAGIDESNGNGYFVLWPEKLGNFCKKIHTQLCQKYGIKDLGIIITDSCPVPLRQGVRGTAIYAYGIQPRNNHIDTMDLFEKPLYMTKVNVIDSLSAAADYLMGESNDATPIVIGRSIPNIEYTTEDLFPSIQIPPTQDLFAPLFKVLNHI